ncbi:hypothetical protein [Streptomyces sp. NPDC002490]|uniref:hypothetical protein n=1 Tax=Streptomyces sp. NPDC002490 TaxID=3154416 RepID=UPI003323E7B3
MSADNTNPAYEPGAQHTPDASVYRAAADVHRDTPRRALEQQARDGSTAVLHSLAGREDLPDGLAIRLAGNGVGDV